MNKANTTTLIDRLTVEERAGRSTCGANTRWKLRAIISYGANAQGELSRFSHQMLDHVKQDISPVGDVLKELMDKLGN